MNIHQLLKSIPLLLGTGTMLGLGAPLAKAANVAGVSALAFALWPTLVAGLALSVLGLLRTGLPRAPMKLARFGLVAGLLGHALPMSALFWLSGEAGAGFASLAFTMPPVFTLTIALLVRMERPSMLRLGAVLLGFAGATLLVTGRGGAFTASPISLILVVCIPAFIGAGNVYRAMRMPAQVSGEWLAAVTLLSSCLLLLPIGWFGGHLDVPAHPAALQWLIAQVVVLIVGYLLYFRLQQLAEPVTFSFMGYVMTLTGVVVGTTVYDEALPATAVPAVLLIFAAFVLVQRARFNPPKAPR